MNTQNTRAKILAMENPTIAMIERYINAQIIPIKKRLRKIEAQQDLEMLGIQEHIQEISERLARLEEAYRMARLTLLIVAVCLAALILMFK